MFFDIASALVRAHKDRMFTREIDEQTGVVVVKATGIWNRAEIEDHYIKLARLIEQVRRPEQPVRILVDLTDCPRQPPEIEAYVLANLGKTHHPGDRVAILVEGEEKQYLRTALAAADAATFSSRLPAEQWLYLPGLRKPE